MLGTKNTLLMLVDNGLLGRIKGVGAEEEA